ncbi:hypothetical protein [Microtetraspora sp. NBRC 16547]|nr:hypothetical protein [Microtetraspora sp. NBRC 16547]
MAAAMVAAVVAAVVAGRAGAVALRGAAKFATMCRKSIDHHRSC